MSRLQLLRTTGTLLILLVVLSNIPYIRLVQTFEYDDILRQPIAHVLTQFHAGGSALIITWFTFGLTALLFIPASILLHAVIALQPQPSRDRSDVPYPIPYLTIATVMGVLSGMLQAVGLMRWVFVIPVLAAIHVNPATSEATRAAVEVAYQVVHQYGGVVIGEQLGQTLLLGWTLGVGMALVRSPLFKSWLGWLGLATVPFWILGQSELFATVIPKLLVWETTPIGFMLWEVWLLSLGIFLLLKRLPKQLHPEL